MLGLRLGLWLGLGSGIRIIVSILLLDQVIIVIVRWGHSDRGHFDIVPIASSSNSSRLAKWTMQTSNILFFGIVNLHNLVKQIIFVSLLSNLNVVLND